MSPTRYVPSRELFARSIRNEWRLAEERTYQRYTGYESPLVFAHDQTQKAVAAYRQAWKRA